MQTSFIAFFGIGPVELIVVIGLCAGIPVAIGLVVWMVIASSSKRPEPSIRPCPDCGRPVSPPALSCPHCGRPFK